MTLSNANGAITLDSSEFIATVSNLLLFSNVSIMKISASSPVTSETTIV